MKKISTIIFCLLYYIVQTAAQINATAATVAATCSSNGKITITATGGATPYTYEITVAPTGGIRPPQQSNVFDNLPKGNYTIKVTDVTGQTRTVTATIGGTYVAPTMNCILTTPTSNTVTLTIVNGSPPFKYEYSRNNFTTVDFSTSNVTDRTKVFNCLTNANYTFRITDACNNFFTCTKTVAQTPLTASWTCQGTGTIALTNVDGGEPPLVYFCRKPNGQTLTNSTGTFSGLTDCSDTLEVRDACGRSIRQTLNCNFSNAAPITVGLTCVSFASGTATLTVQGGTPPYRYKEGFSQISSTGLSFTGLPNINAYSFEIRDACGKSGTYFIERLTVAAGSLCPWGTTISASQNATSSATPGVFGSRSFAPVTVTCTSCTPQIVKTATITNGIADAKFPNVGGVQTFKIRNNCGDEIIYQTMKNEGCAINDCSGTIFVVKNNPSTYGTTYTLKNLQGMTVAGPDTVGRFINIPIGKYIITATNPRMIPTTISFEYELKLKIVGTPKYFCDSMNLTFCPRTGGLFKLFSTTNALIKQNLTGSFGGLTPNTSYIIKAYNANGDFIDQFPVATEGLVNLNLAVTCNSIIATVAPTGIDVNNQPVTYILKNSVGATLATNTSGLFPNLQPDNYTVTASNPSCGSLTEVAGITRSIRKPCLRPSFSQVGAACKAGWDLVFSDSLKVTGLNTNKNTFKDDAGNFIITNLIPGTYNLVTACTTQAIVLPPVPINLIATPTTVCPTIGKIRMDGGRTAAEWNALTVSGFNVCTLRNDLYELLNTANVRLDTIYTPKNTFINNLTAAATYKTYLRVFDSNGALSCPIDTATVTMPLYIRPELTATFGAVCNGATTGSLSASLSGGTRPFKFELLGTAVAPIISAMPSAVFNGLAVGNYTVRGSDTCGISSDFQVSVGQLSFQPQAVRYCNGKIQLTAPNYGGATYIWRKQNGQVVGNQFTTTANNVNTAETYTVFVTLGACSYSASVAVAAPTLPPVIANAGNDIVNQGSSVSLAATAAATGATGTWTAISPTSGVTTFSNANSPNATASVTTSPGTYTYVWTVSNGAGGCTASDTVTVNFLNCAGVAPFSAAVVVTPPASCRSTTGSATVNVNGGTQPFTYKWSYNNLTTQTVTLPVGTYTVTVDDGAPCNAPKTFQVAITIPNLAVSKTQNFTLCSGQSVTVGTRVYSATGNFSDTLKQRINGCDSIINTNLTIVPYKTRTQSATICAGQSYTFNGRTYTTANTYNDIVVTPDPLACDTLVTTILTVVPYRTRTINKAICAGKTYTFNGVNYTQAGSTTTLVNASSPLVCDTLVTVNITIIAPPKRTQTATICAGQSYSFNGNTYTTANTYTDIIPSINPLICDSSITTILNIVPYKTRVINKAICVNGKYTFNGVNYTTAGAFTQYVNSADTTVCDTSITINIAVTPLNIATVNKNICNNTVFSFNGKTYAEAGSYIDTLRATTAFACDTVANITITKSNIMPMAGVTAMTCGSLEYGKAEVLVVGGTAPYTYNWSPSPTPTDPIQTCLTLGTYSVTVTDKFLCTGTAVVAVPYGALEGCFQLNEVFTPNGDGKNDTWLLPCLLEVRHCLEVYNRWGQLVYESCDYKSDWDGRDKFTGKLLPDATYYYVITTEDQIKRYNVPTTQLYKGTVMILRK